MSGGILQANIRLLMADLLVLVFSNQAACCTELICEHKKNTQEAGQMSQYKSILLNLHISFSSK